MAEERAVAERARATELITDQGKTTIADPVVAKIAGIAAREVAGVNRLETQGATGALASLTQRVGGTSENPTQGVRVEVGERETAVDLKMSVVYGVSIPQVTEAVRRNIINPRPSHDRTCRQRGQHRGKRHRAS